MISLRLLLLVLATLGCRELVDGNAEIAPLLASLAVLGVSLGFGLLFKASAVHVLAGSSPPLEQACWERCGRARQYVERGWIAILPVALLATGWGAALNALEQQGLPQAIALLGWFLPSMFLIVLLELTAAQIDELFHHRSESTGPSADAPAKVWANTSARELADESDPACPPWWSEWRLRLRLGDMASLVTCIAPVLVIAMLTDVVRYFAYDLWVTRLVVAATLVALVSVVLFLPVWLGRWMGVVSLPAGEVRERIAAQTLGLNVRGVRPMLLPSRGRWPGAAIVGWFPRFRQLWLGDALIDRLSPRQLDMVVMHELAHVTRRHFLWRILPIVWAAGIVGLFSAFWPSDPAWETAGTVVSSIVASVVMLFGLGAMAHTCELDADRSACTLARQVCPWAQGDCAKPAQELSDALICLLGGSSSSADATWLHPNLQRRLENLSPPS